MKTTFFSFLVALLTVFRPCVAAGEVDVAESAQEGARECFQRAVALYDAHDLDGAEKEFRRAYELHPSYRILYNLGQIANERRDYASALGFFQRYLSDGGAEIPDERRQAVAIEMAKLGTRVAQLSILYSGPSADVLVDGLVVGKAPLSSPLIVNVGHRRVQLRSVEGLSPVRTLEAIGGDLVVANFETHTARGLAKVDVARRAPTATAVDHGSGHTGARVAWIATGVCALATVATGVLAYTYAKDLRDVRERYPVTRDDLDARQRKVHYAAWTTDGLAATTVVLAVVSTFLSFGHDRADGTSLSLTWPGMLNLSGGF